MATDGTPQMQPVVSSQISEIGYEPKSRTLLVRFSNTDALYSYADVPEDVYNQLMNAPSIGSFFYSLIRNGGYSYQRLE